MDAPRIRVLLVDDEGRAARLLARMLREDGYDVEVAVDGAAAIGRLARSPLPHVLVTDVLMPHVDGIAVAKYARSIDPRLPIMFVTGYPQLTARSSLHLSPPPIVYTKPIDYGAFSEALEEISEWEGERPPRRRLRLRSEAPGD